MSTTKLIKPAYARTLLTSVAVDSWRSCALWKRPRGLRAKCTKRVDSFEVQLRGQQRWKKEDMQNMQCHLQVAFGSQKFAWGIYRLGECDVPGWLVVIPVFYPKQVPETDKDLEVTNQCTAELLAEADVAFSCSLAIPCASFDSLWHPAKIALCQVSSELQSAKSEFEEEQAGKQRCSETMSQNSGYEVSWWLVT